MYILYKYKSTTVIYTISFLTLPHPQVQDGRGRAEDCLQHAAPDPGDAQPHQRQAHQRHGQPRQVKEEATTKL